MHALIVCMKLIGGQPYVEVVVAMRVVVCATILTAPEQDAMCCADDSVGHIAWTWAHSD